MAALSIWIWWTDRAEQNETTAILPEATNSAGTNFSVRTLDMVVMDANGDPARKIRAEEMRQEKDSKNSFLRLPQIEVQGDNQDQWKITANSGRLSSDQDRVVLRGQVEITRNANENTPALQVLSEELTATISKGYVETDKMVTIKSGKDQLQGTGMRAWLGESPRIKLLSDVRGHYAAP
jgi:lipopolysaccharide export system protein LptC